MRKTFCDFCPSELKPYSDGQQAEGGEIVITKLNAFKMRMDCCLSCFEKVKRLLVNMKTKTKERKHGNTE